MQNRIWLIGALLLSTLIIVPTAATQNNSDSSEEIIISARASVLFPEGVGFEVDLRRPPESEIIAAILTINVPSRNASNQFPVNLDEMGIDPSDTIVRIPYTRVYDATNAPQVFEEISYRWDVVLQNNLSDSAEGQIVFEDHRTRWRTEIDESLPFTLTAPLQTVDISGVYDALRPAYNLLSETALSPDDFTNVVIYAGDISPICDAEGMVSNLTTEATLPCTPGRYIERYERSGFQVI
ncbi:MAG: hypothetical protein AAF125_26960, partial [Chloroflexota bacterium]